MDKFFFCTPLPQSCVHKFRKWTDQSPLQVKREDDSFNHDEGSYARVVACAYTPDRYIVLYSHRHHTVEFVKCISA